MANKQRTNNDRATSDRREATDKFKEENRNRNDTLTQERRSEADANLKKNRERNDEITSDRRKIKDAKSPKRALAFFLSILIILAVGVYFIFI